MKVVIALPAYNEEKIIRQSIEQLYTFSQKNLHAYDWHIIVADNNSQDKTREMVEQLAKRQERLVYLFVPKKGKGAAIRAAWTASQADIYCFMDADLATDLSSLPKLLSVIGDDHFDIACGSRFMKGSQVARSLLRKMVSVGYRIVLKFFLSVRVKDVPCGFKAVGLRVRDELLPLVHNDEWFFDSELVILAERRGYTIKEIPVIWRDAPDASRSSQVSIFSLSMEYFRKVFELKKRFNKK